MTIAQELTNIVEAIDGHVVAELPIGPQEAAQLALVLAAIAQSVELLENTKVTQAAIDAMLRLQQEARTQ